MFIRGTSVAQEGSTAYDVASVYGHEDVIKELGTSKRQAMFNNTWRVVYKCRVEYFSDQAGVS